MYVGISVLVVRPSEDKLVVILVEAHGANTITSDNSKLFDSFFDRLTIRWVWGTVIPITVHARSYS